jgi:hypothetical protein
LFDLQNRRSPPRTTPVFKAPSLSRHIYFVPANVQNIATRTTVVKLRICYRIRIIPGFDVGFIFSPEKIIYAVLNFWNLLGIEWLNQNAVGLFVFDVRTIIQQLISSILVSD